MTIAPNGVNIADYDPYGVGGIMLAGTYSASLPEGASSYRAGDVVDAAAINLRPAYFEEFDGQPGWNMHLDDDPNYALSGSWMCLGFGQNPHVNAIEFATLWMRVA